MLEQVELENTKTGERGRSKRRPVFSMIGAKPCTNWLPPEIECDEKGFIKPGARSRTRPPGKRAKLASCPRDERARDLRRWRRAFGLGQTLCGRGRRRRNGVAGVQEALARLCLTSARSRRSDFRPNEPALSLRPLRSAVATDRRRRRCRGLFPVAGWRRRRARCRMSEEVSCRLREGRDHSRPSTVL